MADPLIESLERLIRQSTDVFGADDPATLKLKEQLASLTNKDAKKVFWMAPAGSPPVSAKNNG
jgi:hypothetical protein